MEVVAHASADVRGEILRGGRQLQAQQARERCPCRQRARELEPLDKDAEVVRVAEEAALDHGQRGRVARAQPDATRRDGFMWKTPMPAS